jgi:hypothetical protein
MAVLIVVMCQILRMGLNTDDMVAIGVTNSMDRCVFVVKYHVEN